MIVIIVIIVIYLIIVLLKIMMIFIRTLGIHNYKVTIVHNIKIYKFKKIKVCISRLSENH